MGYSYKKVPITKTKIRLGKKFANKKIRNLKLTDILDGSFYRKLYPTWAIIYWIYKGYKKIALSKEEYDRYYIRK